MEEVTMAELQASWIGRWCSNGGERARRSDGDGAAARCFALLRRGRERARCESEVKRAAKARDLSLRAGLTGRAGAGVRPPRGAPGLPPVGH